MTAEPDLPINDSVPAPTKIEPGNLFLWNWRQMQVYAQACVAHATAPLQAKIEALQAEVAELRAARIAYASEFPATKDGGPDTDNIHANIRALKARAEQLAEALREAKEKMLAQVKWVACDCGCEGEKPADAVSIAWLRASTLLHDQEEGK